MRPATFADLISLTAAGPDRFIGGSALEPDGRTFGGQFLAQAVAAAYRTIESDRFVHSLHAYFLRAGDIDLPTAYQVERVRDGRGFSNRAVSATQDGREVFRAMLSFQVPDDGLEFSAQTLGPELPAPVSVETTYRDFVVGQGGEGVGRWAVRPIDLRYVNPPKAPRGEAVVEPQVMWARMTEHLAPDRRLHDAALAYISDSSLLDHVFLPHGKRWQDEEAFGTTVDHSMWWHRPTNANEWLVFEQAVEVTTGTRGLTTARFYTETGDLVASCAQEGLMRWSD